MTQDNAQDPDRGFPPTARSLPIALMRARERVMVPIREMLADSGITEQQWRILRVLSESGPSDATHVAEGASLLLTSLTRISQSMVERGLLSRARDPRDRRRLVLQITPEGQAILDANRARALEIAARVVTVLGRDRYEALLDTLEALEALSHEK